MRGLTIAILIALIAFAIAIVSLALEYFQVFEIEYSIQNMFDISQRHYFLNY